jgi:predicted metal-dependent phosphoesterase TrpH
VLQRRATFDLQAHSTHSDGSLAPADLVAAAHAAGVELISLSDHDTVDGLAEAERAARLLGVGFVPGIEISTAGEAAGDLHILGYLIDDQNRPLRERLRQSRLERANRSSLMAQALRGLGFFIDDDAARRLAGSQGAVGRPHLARAVVSDPRNRERLAAEGVLDESRFLEAYLIEGRPAFRARSAPSVPEAIGLIHGAGGLAVWAHPFWDMARSDDVLATIDRFAGFGLDGVEAFYVTHTRAQTQLLAEECARRGLLSTGSSDFHGPEHSRFSRFLAFDTYDLKPRLGPLAGGDWG